jgi:DinB family protein
VVGRRVRPSATGSQPRSLRRGYAESVGAASDLADEYDATMAELIAFAKSCTDEEWSTICPQEERTVGVLFDHVATGNPQVVAWIEEFLSDKPVEISPEILSARNAEHARKVASRPRNETIGDLDSSTPRTSAAIRALTDEQMRRTQEFGWAGRREVSWVASAAVRHPRGHLKSIRDSLGR